MASTGCPSGDLQTRLRLDQFDEALKAAAEWQDIFGKENYFLELMDHGLEIERRVRDGLIEIGRKLGIPPVVTNDSHYTREQDAQAQDMLLCIQTGKTLAETDRFRFDGTGYFIKPAADMYRLDSSDLWQEGCRNSQLLIADRVDTTGMFEFRNLMPRFPIPDGFESEDELFRAEVWKGMDRRYPGGYDERTAASKPSTRSRSSARWGFPPTSSWWRTSSCGRRTTASRSARAAVPRPARSSPSPWASPTSTRWFTA